MISDKFMRKVLIAFVIGIFVFPASLFSQKVGYVSSDEIRKHFVEAQQVEIRIKSMVENWKKQLADYDAEIKALEFEIKKNRLIWTDAEKKDKEAQLADLKQKRLSFAKEKFETGGEYDKLVQEMKLPIETKIYAAIQEIAADEGYDIVLDKSLHPIPYSNAKYDLTVKVLRKLGVDVKELEKQLQEKIAKDPRNQKATTKEAPKRRSRRRKTSDDRTIEKEKTEESTDVETEQPDNKPTEQPKIEKVEEPETPPSPPDNM